MVLAALTVRCLTMLWLGPYTSDETIAARRQYVSAARFVLLFLYENTRLELQHKKFVMLFFTVRNYSTLQN